MTHKSQDEDDQFLFREYMKGVVPLKKSDKISGATEKPGLLRKPTVKSTFEHEPPQTQVYPLSDPLALEIQAEQVLSHHAPGLPFKHLKMFKKGNFMLDARLDLHGLDVDTARKTLSLFIEQSFKKGYKYLLVIHGKGAQHGQVAILKSHVNHWLKQFPHILAFQSAQAKDGGTGAAYLLLKKHKIGKIP